MKNWIFSAAGFLAIFYGVHQYDVNKGVLWDQTPAASQKEKLHNLGGFHPKRDESAIFANHAGAYMAEGFASAAAIGLVIIALRGKQKTS